MKAVELSFKKRLHEIYSVEPNDLGSDALNVYYKRITHWLKSMPFFIILPVSLFLAVSLYIIFGYLLVRMVSILQYGF